MASLVGHNRLGLVLNYTILEESVPVAKWHLRSVSVIVPTIFIEIFLRLRICHRVRMNSTPY